MSDPKSSTGFPVNFGVTHAYRHTPEGEQCLRTGQCSVTIDGDAFKPTCCPNETPLYARYNVPYGGGSQGVAIYTNYNDATEHRSYL